VIGISRRPGHVGEHFKADLSDPAKWAPVAAHFEETITKHRPSSAIFMYFSGSLLPGGAVVDTNLDDYARAVLVNGAAGQVLGQAFLAVCHRRRTEAALVMCSSPAATIARPGISHYCAGKAALEHWVRTVALEQAELQPAATVFSVVPYMVDTPMVRQAMGLPSSQLPLGAYFRANEVQFATPEEVAGEIWTAITRGVEPGSTAAVGAVPAPERRGLNGPAGTKPGG
jgi:benzil reductase ((S)-benzoin forming)